MPDYKLYRLDSSGQIARAPEEYVAPDDERALSEAEARREGGRAELWEGRRLVRRFSKAS